MPSVYFIRIIGTNTFKVGFTSQNPQVRLKGLQGANPDALELYGFFWCPDRKAEKMCHDNLHEYKIRGEWFELTEDIIDEVIEQFGSYYIEPSELETEEWTKNDSAYIEEELDTDPCLEDIQPKQDNQTEYPQSESFRIRLQQLNDNFTWREIAALDEYKGIPAGTLCSYARGRPIRNSTHRHILGLPQILKINGKTYELTEVE